jgi:uncharacterized protein GlcG (DUF336 family)
MIRLMLTLAVAAALVSGADIASKKALTLSAAKKIAAAAEAEAQKNKWNVVIAIVDDGGNLLYLQRMDGTQIGSIQVAMEKAASSLRFRRPTKVFEDGLKGGRQAILRLPGAIPVEGGLPIEYEGVVIGGIGVSGVQSFEDAQIATAGLKVLAGMK